MKVSSVNFLLKKIKTDLLSNVIGQQRLLDPRGDQLRVEVLRERCHLVDAGLLHGDDGGRRGHGPRHVADGRLLFEQRDRSGRIGGHRGTSRVPVQARRRGGRRGHGGRQRRRQLGRRLCHRQRQAWQQRCHGVAQRSGGRLHGLGHLLWQFRCFVCGSWKL